MKRLQVSIGYIEFSTRIMPDPIQKSSVRRLIPKTKLTRRPPIREIILGVSSSGMAPAMFGSAVIPATPPTIEARPAKESLREMEESTFTGCWLVPKALTAGTRVSAAMMEREVFIVYIPEFS
jgi:hypothetical protein